MCSHFNTFCNRIILYVKKKNVYILYLKNFRGLKREYIASSQIAPCRCFFNLRKKKKKGIIST